ncbi:MAG: hypothetical protein V4722_29005 [Bacteroidota bacterium]
MGLLCGAGNYYAGALESEIRFLAGGSTIIPLVTNTPVTVPAEINTNVKVPGDTKPKPATNLIVYPNPSNGM